MTEPTQKSTPLVVAIDALSKIGILIGAIFAGFQYLEAKQDAKVSRAVSYIDRYESGSISEARRRIDSALVKYLEQFRELDAEGISRADRDALVLAMVEPTADYNMTSDIDSIVSFFEAVRLCSTQGLCDGPTLNTYFQSDDTKLFMSNFEPYFVERRKNNPRYARGLEALLKAPAGSS